MHTKRELVSVVCTGLPEANLINSTTLTMTNYDSYGSKSDSTLGHVGPC